MAIMPSSQKLTLVTAPSSESASFACERGIAAYRAELEDLSATPLPDQTIDQPCELPALLARGIYDADPENRSKREWARLRGISKSIVRDALNRAGIQRTAYTLREKVNSQKEAGERARELSVKIIAAGRFAAFQRSSREF